MHRCMLGATLLENRFEEKALVVLVATTLTMSH